MAEPELSDSRMRLVGASDVQEEPGSGLMLGLVLVQVQGHFTADGEGHGLVGRVRDQGLGGQDPLG